MTERQVRPGLYWYNGSPPGWEVIEIVDVDGPDRFAFRSMYDNEIDHTERRYLGPRIPRLLTVLPFDLELYDAALDRQMMPAWAQCWGTWPGKIGGWFFGLYDDGTFAFQGETHRECRLIRLGRPVEFVPFVAVREYLHDHPEISKPVESAP